MPAYDQGASPPGFYNYLGLTPVDIFGVGINLFPNQYPLTTRLNKLPVGSPSFNFTNDNFRPPSVLLNNAAATGTGTTFVVADATVFDVDDVIKCEGEYMQVTEVNTSTNTLTVARGVCGTTAASHADALPVYLITNARTGAAVNIPQLNRRPTIITQWVQNIQHAYGVGGQILDTTNYLSTPRGPLDNERYHCASECFRDFERALVYGKLQANTSADPTAAASKAKMAGLQQLIVTNYKTGPTNASTYKPSDLIRDTFQASINGGGMLTHLFVSADFLGAFSLWAAPLVRLDAGATVYGTSIDMFAVPFLPNVNVVLDPMLRPGTAIGLNANEVCLRMQRNLYDKPRGSNGDAVQGDMIMRGAIELDNEAHHAFVEGITAFAAP